MPGVSELLEADFYGRFLSFVGEGFHLGFDFDFGYKDTKNILFVTYARTKNEPIKAPKSDNNAYNNKQVSKPFTL